MHPPVIIMIRTTWFNRLESDCNFFQLYCLDAYTEYGYEHSFNCRFLQYKKEHPQTSKREAVQSCKKMMLPILLCSFNNYLRFFIFSFSGIKPIIDFGMMMTLGLFVSFLITFHSFTFTANYFFIRQ